MKKLSTKELMQNKAKDLGKHETMTLEKDGKTYFLCGRKYRRMCPETFRSICGSVDGAGQYPGSRALRTGEKSIFGVWQTLDRLGMDVL
jgi:hypothetical protein